MSEENNLNLGAILTGLAAIITAVGGIYIAIESIKQD